MTVDLKRSICRGLYYSQQGLAGIYKIPSWHKFDVIYFRYLWSEDCQIGITVNQEMILENMIAQMHQYSGWGILAKTGRFCPKDRIRKPGNCEVWQGNGGYREKQVNPPPRGDSDCLKMNENGGLAHAFLIIALCTLGAKRQVGKFWENGGTARQKSNICPFENWW